MPYITNRRIFIMSETIKNRQLRGCKTKAERDAATISVYEMLVQEGRIKSGGAAYDRYSKLIRNKVVERKLRIQGYKKGTKAYKKVEQYLKDGGII